MSVFAKRFKKLREDLGLTQEQIAEKLGVTRPTIAGYESEEKNRVPRKETLNMIANTFGVSTDWLLGNTNNPNLQNNDKEFQDFINDPDLQRWYKELPKSEEEDLRKLKKMWEIIKSEEK
ncbi:helix-turn-helix domain-containing protein [Bacillus sp. CGMCC 1.16607]|uniref:helix-turn-helix domain-containing protein n=1 Tax=Bacillus sp. CGMCC 1.16607 TaxID=3351842 RepID=UPI0036421AC4